ncbi:PilZ domain-containing protein [Pseudodesulfovibrio sp. S3-i]|uniref:PilZ domain-containing protein n=1 Tax=Pseudodesulfovibrio sp. S3-i TaxID=2929474 RepID=UPI001FBAF4F5|nr:PilZ domain-containing protein [Pseudodesulfovibrio sp. S3-i]
MKHGKKKTVKKSRQGSPKVTESIPLDLKDKPKGRKKSHQVTVDPIDETALGFSISLKDDHVKKRHSLRISVKGLKVFIPRLKKSFEVSDISPTGLGFKFEKPRIKGGVKLEMDIVLEGKKEAVGVLCKVMRHERGNVGCAFVELDRAQDDAVHKIVLIGQKQQAERKKAKKDAEFKIPT